MIFSIIEQSFIMLPLLLGAYITISLLKAPDFSLESAYLFGAVTALLAKDLPLPVVLATAAAGGMTVGITVAVLNQVFKLPFLLAAIVTNGLYHGLTQYILGTSMASFHLSKPIDEMFFVIASGGIALGISVLLLRSQLGYSFAIYGNNSHFFVSHGISSKFVVFSGVLVGHALAGISGFLFAMSNGFVDLTMNFGIILVCLTTLMMGKLAIRTTYPSIYMPLVGLIAFFFIQQTLLRVGLNLKYFNAFQACLVLGVLLMGQRKQTVNIDHLGV